MYTDYLSTIYKAQQNIPTTEIEDEEKHKRGLLSRLFGMISNTSVTSALYNATDGDSDTTILGGLVGGLTAMNPFKDDVSNTHTMSDVLNNLNPEGPHTTVGKLGRFVAGLGGDILLDPTTYLSGGLSAIGDVVKGTGTVSKTLAGSEKVASAVNKATDVAENVAKTASNSTKFSSKVDDIVNTLKSAEKTDVVNNAGKLSILNTKDAKNIIIDYYKKIGKEVSEEQISKESLDLQKNFNTKVLKIADNGRDMSIGFNQIPFASKVKIGDRQLSSFQKTLLTNEQIRNIGDNTIAPYYNDLAKKIRTSKLGEKFSKFSKFESLAGKDVKSSATLFHLDNILNHNFNIVHDNLEAVKNVDKFTEYFDGLDDVEKTEFRLAIENGEFETAIKLREFKVDVQKKVAEKTNSKVDIDKLNADKAELEKLRKQANQMEADMRRYDETVRVDDGSLEARKKFDHDLRKRTYDANRLLKAKSMFENGEVKLPEKLTWKTNTPELDELEGYIKFSKNTDGSLPASERAKALKEMRTSKGIALNEVYEGFDDLDFDEQMKLIKTNDELRNVFYNDRIDYDFSLEPKDYDPEKISLPKYIDEFNKSIEGKSKKFISRYATEEEFLEQYKEIQKFLYSTEISSNPRFAKGKDTIFSDVADDILKQQYDSLKREAYVYLDPKEKKEVVDAINQAYYNGKRVIPTDIDDNSLYYLYTSIKNGKYIQVPANSFNYATESAIKRGNVVRALDKSASVEGLEKASDVELSDFDVNNNAIDYAGNWTDKDLMRYDFSLEDEKFFKKMFGTTSAGSTKENFDTFIKIKEKLDDPLFGLNSDEGFAALYDYAIGEERFALKEGYSLNDLIASGKKLKDDVTLNKDIYGKRVEQLSLSAREKVDEIRSLEKQLYDMNYIKENGKKPIFKHNPDSNAIAEKLQIARNEHREILDKLKGNQNLLGAKEESLETMRTQYKESVATKTDIINKKLYSYKTKKSNIEHILDQTKYELSRVAPNTAEYNELTSKINDLNEAYGVITNKVNEYTEELKTYGNVLNLRKKLFENGHVVNYKKLLTESYDPETIQYIVNSYTKKQLNNIQDNLNKLNIDELKNEQKAFDERIVGLSAEQKMANGNTTIRYKELVDGTLNRKLEQERINDIKKYNQVVEYKNRNKSGFVPKSYKANVDKQIAKLEERLSDIDNYTIKEVKESLKSPKHLKDEMLENMGKNVDQIERISKLSNDDKAIGMYNLFTDVMDRVAKEEIRVGRLTQEQWESMRGHYVPHVLTKEGEKYWSEKYGELFNDQYDKVFSKQKGFEKTRTYKTIDEANAKFSDLGFKMFNDSLEEIFLTRQLASNKIIYSEDNVKYLRHKFLKPHTNKEIDGYKTVVMYPDLKNAIKYHIKETHKNIDYEAVDMIYEETLKNMGFDKAYCNFNTPLVELNKEQVNFVKALQLVNIYDASDNIIDITNKMSFKQHEMLSNNYVKLFDKYQTIWKMWNTTVNPGFHIQNAIGNAFQGFLSMGTVALDTKMLKKASDIYRTADPKAVVTLNKTKYTYRQIKQMAEDSGVLEYSFFNTDNPLQGFGQSAKTKGKLKPSVDPTDTANFIPYKIGNKIGSEIEGTQRLSLFMHNIDEGKTIEEAVDNVNKFMFDYNDLTDFEKSVMKRVIPFYTFMRKNAPLQLEQLVNNTNVFRMYDKITDNISKSNGDEYVPENQRNEYREDYVQLPFKLGGENVGIDTNLPFEQLDRMSPKKILGQSSPFIKTPIEVARGKYVYNDIEIDGIMDYLLSLTSPTKIANVSGKKDGVDEDLYPLGQLLGLPMSTL